MSREGPAPLEALSSKGTYPWRAWVSALLLSGCAGGMGEGGGPQDGGPLRTIVFRQFSAAPSLGRGEGSPDPRNENYGALSIFLTRVQERTQAMGAGSGVGFSPSQGASPLADVAANVHQGMYVSGGSLNGVWGFVFNSVPFGPTFPEMLSFLYEGGGIELANQIFAERDIDVVAFPVVGSPAQMSGYFKRPVGVPECPDNDDSQCVGDREGIGLEGLCRESWTLRYLPPSETIVDLACDEFAGPQRLRFVQAIPGGSELLRAVQLGEIDGLEFATVVDDFDAAKGGLFANPSAPAGSDGRNAGEVGLRFAHYPAWHQPFFLGWMVINRSQVWEELEPDQRAAIEEAARESVRESFDASSAILCEFLGYILDVNNGRSQRGASVGDVVPESSADMVLARWRSDDLDRLRRATVDLLNDLEGGDSPSNDQADYSRVITALQDHLGYASVEGMLDAWTEPAFAGPVGCVP